MKVFYVRYLYLMETASVVTELTAVTVVRESKGINRWHMQERTLGSKGFYTTLEPLVSEQHSDTGESFELAVLLHYTQLQTVTAQIYDDYCVKHKNK